MANQDVNLDLRINARWIIPIEGENGSQTVLEDHCLLVRDGVIIAIEPQSNCKAAADQTLDLPHHALMPGWINAHGHAAMTLFRGMADDLPLMTWLQEHIWPAEAQWVSEAFVQHGTELAIAEMLKCGTTTYADMYFFPEASAIAALDSGIRATVFTPILDFPTQYASHADEYIDKALKCSETMAEQQSDAANPRVTIGLGPHAPYTVSDAPLKRVAELSAKHGLPVQIHLHETAHEVAESLEKFGKRPSERLNELGFFSDNVSAVHVTQLDDTDISIFERNNVAVAHCPESNLKLASGFCPTQRLLNAGVTVAIGTDGASSNNDLDMISETRIAALIAKGVAEDATAVPAHTALEMATLSGAKALGLQDITGSLIVGKVADIQAIDLSDTALTPVFDPVSHIVYCGKPNQVSYVWVNGRCLLDQGQLTTLNESQIKRQAREWQQRITEQK